MEFANACNCEMENYIQIVENQKQNETARIIKKIFPVTELGQGMQERYSKKWATKTGTENALEKIKHLTDEIINNNKPKGLIIWGKSGNGKTHLSYLAYKKLEKHNKNIIITTAIDLLKKIEKTYYEKPNYTKDDIFNAIKQSDLLILDDFGTEKYTEKRCETMFEIIDFCYRHNIPMLITANDYVFQKFEEAAELQKIISRLCEMCTKVENTASDYRKEL